MILDFIWPGFLVFVLCLGYILINPALKRAGLRLLKTSHIKLLGNPTNQGKLTRLALWLELRMRRPVEPAIVLGIMAAVTLWLPLLLWATIGTLNALLAGLLLIISCGVLLLLLSGYLYSNLFVKKLDEQLPEILSIMAEESKAGHSLEWAVYRVAKEMSNPARQVFQEFMAEMMLYGGRKSLEDMMLFKAREIKSKNLDMAGTALKIVVPEGGDVPELLARMSEVIRDKQLLDSQIANYTLVGRGSGIMISIIVILIFTVIMLSPVFREQLLGFYGGRNLLGIAVLCFLVGLVRFWRLINVKF